MTRTRHSRSTGRSCSNRSGSLPPRSVYLLSAPRPPRAAGIRLRGAPSALALRPRQPRDDEPVLRSDPLRDPGCVQALRHDLRVDGLDAQRRGRDGQGDAARDRGRRRRHRGVGDRPQSVQQADGRGSAPRHPRRLVQRRRWGGQQAARVRRPGSLPVRLEVRRADRRARPRRRRLPLHRDAGAAQHPASCRRRPRCDQGLRQADPRDRRRDRS